MGWFDEQIRQRIDSDQEMFEDSIFNMASSIVGKKAAQTINDERFVTRKAVQEIIKYYGFRPKESTFNDLGQEIDFQSLLKPYGIMFREVKLTEGWIKEGEGPMMGTLKDSGSSIALIPGGVGGYSYYDYQKAKLVKVNSKNAENISEDALCFYRPLPLKKLTIPDLFEYMRKCINISDIVFMVILAVLTAAIGLIIPLSVKLLTGYVVENSSMTVLISTSLLIMAATVSVRLIEIAHDLMEERVEIKTSLNVSAAVMNRMLTLPAGFFRKYTAGELAARINSVESLCNLLMDNLFSVPLVAVTSLFYLFEVDRFAPSLMVPAIAVLVLTLLVSVVTILIQMGITSKTMQYDAHEDGISYALINGIQKIRLAGAEKRAFANWANDFTMSADLNYNPPTFIKINGTIVKSISLIGTVVIYYMAVISNTSPSEYIAFSVAYGILQGAFSSIAEIALSTAQIKPILDMARPILDAEPENNEGKIIVNRLSGSIEVSNVHFAYEERLPEVLKGISFKVRSGEYVAIVGRTGCGKSTLLRLLMGFEKPTKGAVYYDGKDLARLDPDSVRRKIGVVTQDGSLFQGDIYSNIVITDPFLSVQDAWEAAEIAGIADDIREMPMGMNTVISEGQGGISGGQKQRLMIARAVAPKPKILMFDEATSALDNVTQKKVSDALDKLECTRIVIAHRLSTIKNCDRILVLDDGKVAEEGTYDELVAKQGIFAKLVERQRLN
ncbi:MAG: ATP-binding cassette domain-containing protein [Butyrivibrio sp.]|nr:ATP-binding cassette domain-containing protein [Butyrivibrio sp.]